METDYQSIFRHRGASYHAAMNNYPRVRDSEFQNLFWGSPLTGKEAIIDCPSLGGYLQEAVREAPDVKSLDFCFSSETVTTVSEGDWPITNPVDRVVCLASSHHMEHLQPYVKSVESHLKTGGIFHLADVDDKSPIALFLDEFVGNWTSTGHNGVWRNFSSFASKLEDTGSFKVKRLEQLKCPWYFPSKVEALDFCRLLFGLDLNPTDEAILDALEKFVGIRDREGRFSINWRLTYVDFQKLS